MKLTPKMLTELEESLWIFLTIEQRAIMLCWFGTEPRHGWDESDFLHGFHKVRHYYPDHREIEFGKKTEPIRPFE